MEFIIKSGSPEKQRTACVVVGVFEPRKLTPAGEQIDHVSNGYLSDIIRRGDMEGKAGSILLLHNVPNTLCDRVLLIGLGKEREFKDQEYCNAIATAVRTLNDTGSMEATSYLPELPARRRDIDWKIEQAVLSTLQALYRFDQLKSKPDEVRRPLRRMTLCVSRRNELSIAEKAVERGLAISRAISLTKDLANLPGNICTPTYLADKAKEIAKDKKLKLEILEQADMEKLGMGALLSVARGSRQPPKLIVLHYKGGTTKQKPLVLIGKGITFDAGGISLKPAGEMDEMKYDMCGAASVLAAIQAAAELKLPVNLTVIVPASENLPDGNANKPGDVVTSLSGQTIEVLNTDAEGRLVLCDALTYAERFDPELVVDVATLTGACIIALGHIASGLLSNSDSLARDLLHAGDHASDRVWQLPLWDDYQEQLKSNFADMANIGGRPAGTITAACFLSRFAKKFDWAHLDIAGTAWKSGKDKGATGRPVPLLIHFLIQQAEAPVHKPSRGAK
ncbi:MAG: leucyl aminopeptidase [Burkholderiales bacterium]